MANVGQTYVYALFICVCAVALLSDRSVAIEREQSNRVEKRSITFDDWKRAGQAGYLNELESALGTMQRPRFGKRFARDEPIDDYVMYTDKRGNSLADLGAALGTIQRPRFGRRR